DECASVPCQNGGWCIDTTTSFRCHCEGSRYIGTNCEIDTVNDCVSNQCKNGATCNDGVNSYTCSCKPGYTGNLCD
ncbi:hypothetical protein LOTGIDRAFT_60252, partial [Lottia gigantea]